MKKINIFLPILFLLIFSTKALAQTCKTAPISNQIKKLGVKQLADQFIIQYTIKYKELFTASWAAAWKAQTEIKSSDSTNNLASERASEAFASFTGSQIVIDSARFLLGHKKKLSDFQVRLLNQILYLAGTDPEIVKDLVKMRIEKKKETILKLYGFEYKLNGKPISINELNDKLQKEKNLQKRLEVWQASKEVGKNLKGDLVVLRSLRNRTVQALGYKDFFSYQVAEYDMTSDEMIKLNEDFIRSVWPLYREIHTYFRYELAKQYQVPVPDYLPAHWLPNQWGQDWSALIDVKGANLDSAIGLLTSKDIIEHGEKFYLSLGFKPLPQTFWSKSSLYPYPTDSTIKKNTGASSWHINLDDDVRTLISVKPNTNSWKAIHHELGHIYYYLAYSNPQIPILLRGGANRAYHEAIGDLIGLASIQLPYLQSQKIISPVFEEDSIKKLFKEALNYVVRIPWASGVMTHFEKDLYAENLDSNQINKDWWKLVKKYQGIIPPAPRGEEYCDAATKTHIIDDPAQYYDHAISYCLLMQLHMHIAKKILHQNPHRVNYYNSKKTGDFLKSIMIWGHSKDWRKVLKKSTGDQLNANAMMEYFNPLMSWLQKQNKGRKHTLELETD